MLKIFFLRIIGAGFAIMALGLGRIYFDDVAFGTFAYIVQSMTILVVFGQSGLAFLIFKSMSRNQIRVVYQLFYVLLLGPPLVCLITLICVQLITGVPLGSVMTILIIISVLAIIMMRCFGSVSLGLGQNTRYQIWDQSLRWAPLALVMLALFSLQYFNSSTSSLQTVLILSTCGYLILALVAASSSTLFRSSTLFSRKPHGRLLGQLFSRGLAVNTPNAMLFLLGVIDQFILIRILDIADYGIYRIAALAITVLAMVVDVLGLSIRRKFIAERNAQKRRIFFNELRTRFQILAMFGLMIAGGLFTLANNSSYAEYLQLSAFLVIGYCISLLFGDPMFALKTRGKENLATTIVIVMMVISPPVIWGLITAYGMIGAAIANGLIMIVTKFLLIIAARRTNSI